MSKIKKALAELHPRHFFLETWKEMDREAAEERKRLDQEGKNYDFRPLIAFCFGGVFLTLMEYWGSSRIFNQLVNTFSEKGNFWYQIYYSENWELYNHAWWSLTRVLGFFLLPLILIKLYGGKISDHGLSTQGFREHAWIYFFLYSIVLVCVIIVSFDSTFVNYYPFYSLSHRSYRDLITWELLYAAQFFSLEFFFRGFWLQAGKRMMGSHAIFAMTVPYVMIHFGKPMAETIGATIAGVVLGTLAMKTRSIWSGFLIHVSVALSMDIAALLQKGQWPAQW